MSGRPGGPAEFTFKLPQTCNNGKAEDRSREPQGKLASAET